MRSKAENFPKETLPDERRIIDQILPWAAVGETASGLYGVGDDCAAIPMDDEVCLLTKDLLVEGTHFLNHASTDWRLLGEKAARCNLSDLAASGGQPVALLVGLVLPPEFQMENLEKLYQGMASACKEVGATIAGGDTTRGAQVTLCITAVGKRPRHWAACLRSDARPGDFLYVTGPLGGSRAGLELLLDPKRRALISDEDAFELRDRHFRAPSRVAAARALARRSERLALLDISDSLFNECCLLAKASAVQVEVWLEKVPVHPGAAVYCDLCKIDPQRFALFSGEEYELLIASPKPRQELLEHFRESGVEADLIEIGTIKPGHGCILMEHGKPVEISDETFSHFP